MQVVNGTTYKEGTSEKVVSLLDYYMSDTHYPKKKSHVFGFSTVIPLRVVTGWKNTAR